MDRDVRYYGYAKMPAHPKPTAIKQLTGRRPGVAAGGLPIWANPDPSRNKPVRPDFVTDYAEVVWNEITRGWAKAGLVWEVDSQQLGNYCVLQARMRHLILAGQDLPVGLVNQVIRYAGMFGLSPSDRGRLVLTAEQLSDDPLTRLRERRKIV